MLNTPSHFTLPIGLSDFIGSSHDFLGSFLCWVRHCNRAGRDRLCYYAALVPSRDIPWRPALSHVLGAGFEPSAGDGCSKTYALFTARMRRSSLRACPRVPRESSHAVPAVTWSRPQVGKEASFGGLEGGTYSFEALAADGSCWQKN